MIISNYIDERLRTRLDFVKITVRILQGNQIYLKIDTCRYSMSQISSFLHIYQCIWLHINIGLLTYLSFYVSISACVCILLMYMYMYVHLCIYLFSIYIIYLYLSIHLFIYLLSACLYSDLYTHIHICIIYMCVCVRVFAQNYTYRSVCVCVCICTRKRCSEGERQAERVSLVALPWHSEAHGIAGSRSLTQLKIR